MEKQDYVRKKNNFNTAIYMLKVCLLRKTEPNSCENIVFADFVGMKLNT